MDPLLLKDLLISLKKGEISVEECMEQLKELPFKNIGIACIDHHRSIRKGVPEVIFGKEKEPYEIISIMKEMTKKGENILITKLSEDKANIIKKDYPEARYNKRASILVLINRDIRLLGQVTILVVSAGTSDIPVAEEAVVTAEFMGNRVDKLYDVGVAGIHRLFSYMERIKEASVIIVVAGMEGALPSVIAGIVDKPIIAVPTSTGYGAAFSGITALLSMLNSCAPGVTVVNIDNGFGAAYAASMINRGVCDG